MNRILNFGTWIASGCPVITEVISTTGLDWLLFDLEHNYMQENDVLANIQATGNRKVTIIVRVDEFRPGLIARVLDWGASGIMMPHVSNAGEAKRVVEAMYYPPYGNRGFSSSARSFQFGKTTPQDMEEWVKPLLLAQIENYEGVMCADEIAAVEGVDMLFAGPRDLKLDLSVRKNPDERFDFDLAIRKIATSAKNNKKQAGILVNPDQDISELRKIGFNAFAVGSDMSVLCEGYKRIINNYHLKIK